MKKKTPFVVKILYLTAITIIVWIGTEIVTTLIKKPDPVLSPEILSPINPTLDSQVLNKLQIREENK